MRQKNSQKVFLDLLEPIKDSLYGYACRSVWRKDQVGDVIQEAFLTGWREFGRYQSGTNFRAWMFQILVNTIFRLNKRERRNREIPLEDEQCDLHATLEREEAWSELLDRPDMLIQLLDERLVHSLERLGPDEHQCFLLRIIQNFSYKEIASMLSIPLGTVMSHVHRARMKLREELAALAVEHGFIKETV